MVAEVARLDWALDMGLKSIYRIFKYAWMGGSGRLTLLEILEGYARSG